jgi:hypothetical protein
MKEKYIQRLINKVISEAPVDYGDYPERMHPRTQSNIENPEKNLYGKNKAFKGGTSDVEKMTSRRFKDIVDYVKRYYGIVDDEGRPNKGINITDPRVKYGIQMEQMRAVQEVMRFEGPKKNELKDLALEIAAKEEGWLPYSKTLEDAIDEGMVEKEQLGGAGTKYKFEFINVEAFLNEKRIDPNQFQMEKEDEPEFEIPANFSFDVDELTPEEEFQLEVQKRNIINAIIQGKGKKGQFAFQAFKDRLDEIDPRLYPLYNKIMSANDLMYFTDEDLIEAMGGNAAGSSGVDEDGEDEDKDVVIANGLIFPILLHELVKGFAAIPTREQWRGMDPGRAQDVMGQTDVFSNEPMQFRVGGELITKLRFLLPDDLTVNIENRDLLPFFERLLYAVPAEEFLKDIMANVVSEDPRDNDKAKRKFNELLVKAKEDYKKFKEDSGDDYEDEDEDDDILSKLGF